MSVDNLMKDILPLAERMLRDYGEFYPYGGYVRSGGEIVHVGAKGDTDHPKSQTLIDMLRSSFQDMARRNECRATAIAFDVAMRLPNSDHKSDVIQVCLDHVGGYSAELFFSYKVIDNRLIYGETLAREGKHEIFPPQ